MNIKQVIVGAYLLIFTGVVVFAQSKSSFVSKIEEAFYEERFQDVLRLSGKLEAKYSDANQHLFYKTVAEHQTIKRGSDFSNLLAFQDTRGKTDPFYNYWLGKVYIRRYEFDKARKRLEAFKEIDNYKSPQLLAEVDLLLSQIDRAQEFYENPDNYEIEPLPEGINTPAYELSPAFFGGHNELVFASNRAHEAESQREIILYDFYHSIKSEEGWSDPTKMNFLDPRPYEKAKVEIIDKTNRMYLYRDDKGADIIYSQYENGKWTPVKAFDASITDKHIGAHFFINDDEDMIYFAAGDNMNHDIWQTQLENGTWSEPMPVPGNVNSEDYDDDNPFLSHNGDKLYFSSNRPESIGGYDVFVSTWDENKKEWGTPENMGFPINTTDDDINFEILPGDKTGYLSSNRLHSVGNYDLYYFHEIYLIPVSGTVTDQKTGQPVANARVEFHPLVYQDEAFVATTDDAGNYSAKVINREDFHLKVLMETQVIHEEEYGSYGEINAASLKHDVELSLPEEFVDEDYVSIYEGDQAEEATAIAKEDKTGDAPEPEKPEPAALDYIFYFDLESAQLKGKAKQDISKVYQTMEKFPELRLIIAGHTDNTGPEGFNKSLSEQRAQAVKRELVAKGIAPERIETAGYGESRPVAPNDTPEDRSKNRRAEIESMLK